MRVYKQLLFLKQFISSTKSDKYSIVLSSRKITITNTHIYLSSTTSFRKMLLWSYSRSTFRALRVLPKANVKVLLMNHSLLTQQQVRSIYLLTYNQSDLSIFPDKESFASSICEAILKCDGPKAKIVQWTCYQEKHKNGGTHFHMAIKLNRINTCS